MPPGGFVADAIAKVSGRVGAMNGGGRGNGVGQGGGGADGSLQRVGSGKVLRWIEEIKLLFEGNRGAIDAIYNRAA